MSDDVRMLLDGLGVPDLAEARRLVELGRAVDEIQAAPILVDGFNLPRHPAELPDGVSERAVTGCGCAVDVTHVEAGLELTVRACEDAHGSLWRRVKQRFWEDDTAGAAESALDRCIRLFEEEVAAGAGR